jgi:AraC-like DNA-binding protein
VTDTFQTPVVAEALLTEPLRPIAAADTPTDSTATAKTETANTAATALSTSAATTSSAWVNLILHGAMALGLSRQQLLASSHLSPTHLEQPLVRIPQQQVTALWHTIHQHYDHDDLPLRIGEQARLEHTPIISYAMLSSDTLGDALKRLLRFQRLIGEAVKLPLIRQRERIILRFQPREPVPDLSVTTAMAALVTLLRQLLQSPLAPLRVTFAIPQPHHLKAWQQCFGCAVEFDAPGFELHFQAQELVRPMPQADEQAANTLDRIARHAMQQLHQEQAPQYVRYWLEQALLVGQPHRQWVAKALGISVSTLQRRLRHHGLCFRELLDGVRQQRARYYLEQGMPLKDIAAQLGYQEQSNFQRAFKRWFGMTPLRYSRTTKNKNIK